MSGRSSGYWPDVIQRSDTATTLFVVVGLVLLAVLVAAAYWFVRLLRLWRLARDPAMPAAGKFAFWAALIYAVSPVDVLPDPIYLDDLGVLMGAVAYILGAAKKAGLLDRRRGPRGAGSGVEPGPPAARPIEPRRRP